MMEKLALTRQQILPSRPCKCTRRTRTVCRCSNSKHRAIGAEGYSACCTACTSGLVHETNVSIKIAQ